ncbi:MAG: homogentisate 1,2-dioxygenase [Rickettsiales bacterium]|nr:homogentisate 1,2-dioxygenase [Rickettsiales bacterium]
MKHINVTQGSEVWLKLRKGFFTASEAPMMMGDHKNISRNQLLDAKKGWTTIVDDYLQALFDKGHATEEAARPLAAADVGEDLFPVTGSLEVDGLDLLASFDGLTMFDDVCFEHKLFNKTLAENVLNNVLEPHYYWQLEQQLLVSGAEKCYFVTSDGTKDNWQSMYYVSVPERREALIKGWKQFAIDLESHEPQAKTEKVISNSPVRDLPAINYKMNGLALESNLEAYKQAATDLVALSEKALESDQDFADAEARQKVFTKAEKDIKDACDRVMGEIDSIDTFVKDMRFISEQIRQARLAEGKQIKARKEELRQEILNKANQEASNALNEAMAKVNAKLPNFDFNPAGAMKGKRTIESLQDAADGEVAKAKIQINEFVELAMGNALHLSTQAQGYDFLFNDWAQIAFKPTEDFKTLVTARIATYQAEQKAKEDAQRERIRQEEQAKLQREAEARARAEREAEAQKKREEQAKRDAEEKARVDAEVEQKPEIEKKESPTNEPKEEVQPEQEAKPATSVVRQEQSPTRQYGIMELNAMDQLAKLVEEANKPYAGDLREFVESVKANNLKKVA